MSKTLVDPQDAAASPKPFIRTTVEYSFDTHLAECGSTHDTGFDSDVKCRVCKRVCPTRE